MPARSSLNRRPAEVVSRLDRRGRAVLVLVLLTAAARSVYAVAIADPGSGPDAPTYDVAAAIFADHGIFAAAPGIPYWPAGYPAFVSIFYWAFGHGTTAFAVAQVLLLAGATWSAYRIAKRLVGERAAVLSAVALCISPALTGAGVLLMYETPILVGLVFGADLLLTAAGETGAARRGRLYVAAGLVVGLFATMQATIVAPAVVLAGLSMWRSRDRTIVRVGLSCAFLVAMMLGPLVLVVRNVHRGDGFGFAGNLGVTMLVGGGAAGREIPCGPTDHTVEGDRDLTRCALEHKVRHPLETTYVAADISWRLWAPMVGPARKYGSWYHAFDYRRLVPDSFEYTPGFQRFDRVTSKVWEVATIALVLGGMVLLLRRSRDRSAFLWLALPVLIWTGMHALIAGDARFRLPVSPFYVPLMAVAVLAIADDVRTRTRGRDAAAGPAAPNR